MNLWEFIEYELLMLVMSLIVQYKDEPLSIFKIEIRSPIVKRGKYKQVVYLPFYTYPSRRLENYFKLQQ